MTENESACGTFSPNIRAGVDFLPFIVDVMVDRAMSFSLMSVEIVIPTKPPVHSQHLKNVQASLRQMRFEWFKTNMRHELNLIRI